MVYQKYNNNYRNNNNCRNNNYYKKNKRYICYYKKEKNYIIIEELNKVSETDLYEIYIQPELKKIENKNKGKIEIKEREPYKHINASEFILKEGKIFNKEKEVSVLCTQCKIVGYKLDNSCMVCNSHGTVKPVF